MPPKRRGLWSQPSYAKRAKALYDAQSSQLSNALVTHEDDADVPPVPEDRRPMENLSDQIIVELMDHHKNIFIEGPAGSGKSCLINLLRAKLQADGKRVAVIAPTGSAALNIEGTTCHSFFGLTPITCKNRHLEEIAEKGDVPHIRSRLTNIDVLIIDEISMISKEFFQKMWEIMGHARNRYNPYLRTSEKRFPDLPQHPSLRLVVVGDFSQLSPVKPQEYCGTCGRERRVRKPGKTYYCARCQVEVQDEDKWTFRAPEWELCNFKNILLREIYRQSQPWEKQLVWDMFLGNPLLTPQKDYLARRVATANNESQMRLCCLRRDVNKHNDVEYAQLTAPENVYNCFDQQYGHVRSRYTHAVTSMIPGTSTMMALNDHAYSPVLKLKAGMPVVLITNLDPDKGLVNGRRGYIVDWKFVPPEELPRPSDDRDENGFTWDVEDGVRQRDWVGSVNRAHPTAATYALAEFAERNGSYLWPVVQFDHGERATIFAHSSKDEWYYDEDCTTLQRTQLPLLPAWAMTVHRSQGMTIDNYVADIATSFCEGQEYVALTRATAFDHFTISKLPRNMSRTPQEVRDFRLKTFPELRGEMREHVRRRRGQQAAGSTAPAAGPPGPPPGGSGLPSGPQSP